MGTNEELRGLAAARELVHTREAVLGGNVVCVVQRVLNVVEKLAVTHARLNVFGDVQIALPRLLSVRLSQGAMSWSYLQGEGARRWIIQLLAPTERDSCTHLFRPTLTPFSLFVLPKPRLDGRATALFRIVAGMLVVRFFVVVTAVYVRLGF